MTDYFLEVKKLLLQVIELSEYATVMQGKASDFILQLILLRMEELDKGEKAPSGDIVPPNVLGVPGLKLFGVLRLSHGGEDPVKLNRGCPHILLPSRRHSN